MSRADVAPTINRMITLDRSTRLKWWEPACFSRNWHWKSARRSRPYIVRAFHIAIIAGLILHLVVTLTGLPLGKPIWQTKLTLLGVPLAMLLIPILLLTMPRLACICAKQHHICVGEQFVQLEQGDRLVRWRFFQVGDRRQHCGLAITFLRHRQNRRSRRNRRHLLIGVPPHVDVLEVDALLTSLRLDCSSALADNVIHRRAAEDAEEEEWERGTTDGHG